MKRILTLFILCLLWTGSLFAAVPSFKKIVIFGDSLSDNGNLYEKSGHLIPKSPPYFRGRFSNGYTWSDIVTNYFSSNYNITSENYAVGGATAVFHNPFSGFLPVTIDMEVASYNLKNMFSRKANTLYCIWIGGNDYLSGVTNIDQATTAVVNAIVNTIQTVWGNPGAQFFIIDMPDLDYTPRARQLNMITNYQQIVAMHNQKLHAAILQLKAQYPSVKITEFNFTDHPILKDVVTSQAYRDEIKKKYGIDFKNVTDACWSGSYLNPNPNQIENNLRAHQDPALLGNTNLTQLSQEIAHNPSLLEAYRVSMGDGVECENSGQYVFWDNIHPTGNVHKILASTFLGYMV